MKAYQIYCKEWSFDPCLGSDRFTKKIGNPYKTRAIAEKHLPSDQHYGYCSYEYFIKEIEIEEE